MGMFDDLVPAQTKTAPPLATPAAGGLFDDLIPSKTTAPSAKHGLIDIEFPGYGKNYDIPEAYRNPTSGVAPPAPVDPLQSFHDTEAAALQGVNPNSLSKYFPEKPANKPEFLGHVEDLEGAPGFPVYRLNNQGEQIRVNPKTDFIMRDPDDPTKLGVYARNPQTDENRIVSASRLLQPSLAVGPVGAIGASARAAEAASEATAALPHSSALPPAGVVLKQPLGALATPTGAAIATGRSADLQNDVAAFDRLGVRKVPIAFMQGPMASVGEQLSKTPIVGSPMKNALDEALNDAARAAENVAARYGSASTPETAGTAIQEGIARYRDARPEDVVERAMQKYSPEQLSEIIGAPARDTSMKTKQAALYQRSWSFVPEDMQRGRTKDTLPRYLGEMRETRKVIGNITDRNLGMMNKERAARMGVRDETAEMLPTKGKAIPKIALPIQGGMLGQIIGDISGGNWRGTLQNMRDIRSDFRRLASGITDTEKNTLRLSDIERIKSAVTRDMVHLLQRNADAYKNLGRDALAAGDVATAKKMNETAQGTERAIKEFRRADLFTRLSAERMERIDSLFNAKSAESLYRNIVNAALSKGKGDLEKLRILSKTLRPEELNDVAAAVIRQLGEPIGSARGSVQEAGFSPTSFLTRYANMTPEARSLLFGHDHAEAIGDLFRVVNRLANVEALANTSRSGTNVLNMSGLVGMGTMIANGQIFLAGALGGTGLGASILLSRPSYVRWVTEYAKLRAAVLRAPVNTAVPAMAAHINRLEQLAEKNPLLLPAYHQVAAQNGVVEGNGDEQQKK